ncbi:MAG: 50S ribosomal protein L18 [Bacteriovoracales bacterium]|nr:50S ribosomal protein L18 [Bacteriovoracales bacterium]
MRKPIGKIGAPKRAKQMRRKLAIRKKVKGTAERPRICAIRSNRHLVVQVIDDVESKTIASVQTFGKNALKAKVDREGAKVIGQEMAKRLQKEKILEAVFDRNGNIYTGIVAALAEGLREGGIKI